jgi:uncharacterized protein (TIGR02246 family)
MRRTPIHASPEAAEDAFYDAMQRGDVGSMLAVWADDDDAVCVHPNGPRLVGLEAIRTAWARILAGGGVDVRVAERRVHRAAAISVHSLIERVLVEGSRGRETVECVVTNVYVRDAGGWRMLVHHASAGTDAAEGGGDEPEAPGHGDTLH